MSMGARFPIHHRKALLLQPGIGPVVIHRLEAAGFHSLEQLRAVGALRAVLTVCDDIGNIAWANRRHALEQALLNTIEAAPAGASNRVDRQALVPA